MPLTITSPAFADESMIPQRFTCDGVDASPPLSWDGAPRQTKSFALICDDPDAPGGVWVHWVVFNIPVTATGMHEAVVPGDAVQGANSWGGSRYGGPCPPGGTHRYFFKLYALDTKLDLPPGIRAGQLETAMHGHVLAEATLMGRYSREK